MYHKSTMEQAKRLPHVSGFRELRLLVLSARPRQWSKNLIIYFAFFFAVNRLWDSDDLESIVAPFARATIAFLIFCAISGAVYLINDWADLKQDRVHTTKRHRPLASSQLRLPIALAGMAVLLAIGLTAAFLLEPWFGLTTTAYLALMVAYSLVIKRIAILDVMAISAGFVLRAAAGAVAIGVPVSPWLYITTSLGALFIGFGKRRNELQLGGDEAEQQRGALRGYSRQLLDRLLVITAGTTVIAYILYTITAGNLPDNHAMMLTIPVVVFGIVRYLYLIQRRSLGESPEEVFLSDVPLIISILLWLATAASVLLFYGT